MKHHLAITVMIVDDDATSRKLLKSILLSIGIQAIDEQESGEAAWDRLQDRPVDLILADWHMGDMSGLELLKRVHGDARFQQTKVVMVTSEDRQTHIVQAIRTGIHGYIMKPFSKHSIQEKILALFPSSGPSPRSAEDREDTQPSQQSTEASISQSSA